MDGPVWPPVLHLSCGLDFYIVLLASSTMCCWVTPHQRLVDWLSGGSWLQCGPHVDHSTLGMLLHSMRHGKPTPRSSTSTPKSLVHQPSMTSTRNKHPSASCHRSPNPRKITKIKNARRDARNVTSTANFYDILYIYATRYSQNVSRSEVVITLDFESSIPSSNLGGRKAPSSFYFSSPWSVIFLC